MRIEPTKPTLRELREQHHFDVVNLSRSASVHESTVIDMLRGIVVYSDAADRVFAELSGMIGVQYNRENVRVALIDEGKKGPDTTSSREKHFERINRNEPGAL